VQPPRGVTSSSTSAGRCSRPRRWNSDPLFVGRETFDGKNAHDGSATRTGLIDELNVWAQPLSALEVKAHYDAAAPTAKER